MEGFIVSKNSIAIKTISERIQAGNNQSNTYIAFKPRENSDKDDQAKKELERRLRKLRA